MTPNSPLVWLPNPGKSNALVEVTSSYVPSSGDCLSPIRNDWVGRLVRCRRCRNCRRWSAKKWFGRNLLEVRTAPRSWFVTLTLRNPVATYSDVQLWLKRVRKGCHPTPVKYVVVLESGSLYGRLHWHLIMTSTDLAQREIRSPYRGGISEAKLIEKKDQANYAGYICSYIAKSAIRTTASKDWGWGWEGVPF